MPILASKADYVTLLRSNVCTVVFRKSEDVERTMICTLMRELMEALDLVPLGTGDPGPEYQVRCIDVEKEAWRSFNIGDVISFDVNIDQDPLQIQEGL